MQGHGAEAGSNPEHGAEETRGNETEKYAVGVRRADDAEGKPGGIADEIGEEELDGQDKTEGGEEREPEDGEEEPQLGRPVAGAVVYFKPGKRLCVGWGRWIIGATIGHTGLLYRILLDPSISDVNISSDKKPAR